MKQAKIEIKVFICTVPEPLMQKNTQYTIDWSILVSKIVGIQ